jgi:hypothetical protein
LMVERCRASERDHVSSVPSELPNSQEGTD